MLVTTPDSIRKQDIDRLKKLGLAEQTIEDAMNVVSLFSLVNRLVDGIGVKGGEQYFKMVGQALASNGYAKLLA
jgi:hypothetical protein